MYLLELIADIDEVLEVVNKANVEISSVAIDSREVKNGSLFMAIKGFKVDGAQFIPSAIENGAAAILTDSDLSFDVSVPVIRVKNMRKVVTLIASRFYSKHVKHIVAVTGTNGKTSTVNFCKQMWEILGFESASLGTIGIRSTKLNTEGNLTLPDPISLHSDIQKLSDFGVEKLALEASSQGMDQYRLDGLKIKAGAFTNLTQDHLDYHGTMEAYFKTKARLFEELVDEGGYAIINKDVEWEDKFEESCAKRKLKVLTYGEKGKDIKLLEHHMSAHGQKITIEVLGKKYSLDIPLIGEFQIYNAMCALGLVISEKLDDKDYIDKAVFALEKLKSVRGRLELAAILKNGAAIYVDYAHTPDAVISVLKSIRPHVSEGSKLHAIVGCGGDRDRTKRPKMGKAAVELADVVIVTDDNPRTEDPTFIRSEVMAGAVGATEIAGRDKAIKQAVANLKTKDILVIAGKGHEDYQIIGTTKFHLDDVEEVQKAVKEIEG